MQDGFSDCSSTVFRSAIAAGKTEWCLKEKSAPTSNELVYDADYELLWPETYAEIGKKLGGNDVIAKFRKKGNVLFFNTISSTTRQNKITHVATALGDGKLIQTASAKDGRNMEILPDTHYGARVCAIISYNPTAKARVGQKGARVRRMQAWLKSRGESVEIDGAWSAAVDAAWCRQTEKAAKGAQPEASAKPSVAQVKPKPVASQGTSQGTSHSLSQQPKSETVAPELPAPPPLPTASSWKQKDGRGISGDIMQYFIGASTKYKVPIGVLLGTCEAESNFRLGLVSSANAVGPMQFKEKYASDYYRYAGFPFDLKTWDSVAGAGAVFAYYAKLARERHGMSGDDVWRFVLEAHRYGQNSAEAKAPRQQKRVLFVEAQMKANELTYADTTLKGSNKMETLGLQKFLNLNGGYGLVEDGIVGPKTMTAYEDYKKKAGVS